MLEWASITLYRLGLQYYSFNVKVKFSSGKVSSVQRSIRVQTDAYEAYPASVITESAIYPDDPSTFAPADQPLLILRHASNVPELGVRIKYRGNVSRTLTEKEVYVAGEWYGVYGRTFNPVLMLLEPGRQLILFQHPEDDGEEILDPCQAIAATPTALKALQTALRVAP